MSDIEEVSYPCAFVGLNGPTISSWRVFGRLDDAKTYFRNEYLAWHNSIMTHYGMPHAQKSNFSMGIWVTSNLDGPYRIKKSVLLEMLDGLPG